MPKVTIQQLYDLGLTRRMNCVDCGSLFDSHGECDSKKNFDDYDTLCNYNVYCSECCNRTPFAAWVDSNETEQEILKLFGIKNQVENSSVEENLKRRLHDNLRSVFG